MRFDPRNALPDSLRTPRLLLRAPMRADVPALAELADNRAIFERLARLPHPYTRADAIGFVEIVALSAGTRAYAIVENRAFIGIVSLMFAPGHPPELGYWLGQPYWGRGLASEAVRALLDAAHATGQFPLIQANALETNTASLNVLEKAGFRRTGRHASTAPHTLGQTVIELLLGEDPEGLK